MVTKKREKAMNFERITSRKNDGVISAASLCDKKHRDDTGLFAFEGIKLLREANECGVEIVKIYFTESALSKYGDEIERSYNGGATLFCVTDEVYAKLSAEKNPEGIYTVAKKFEFEKQLCSDGGYLILCDVQNPSNVGTVIRTACALGIDKVLLTPGCADIFGPKTQRAAMGTVFRTKFYKSDDIKGDIEYLKSNGKKVYASALTNRACDIRNVSFSHSDSIIIGNEGKGLPEDILSSCSDCVIIPMCNGAESLNAAAAAAIFIWEKQKGLIK